jgi:hypothetical protein
MYLKYNLAEHNFTSLDSGKCNCFVNDCMLNVYNSSFVSISTKLGESLDQFINIQLLKIGYGPRYLFIPFVTNSVISPTGV